MLPHSGQPQAGAAQPALPLDPLVLAVDSTGDLPSVALAGRGRAPRERVGSPGERAGRILHELIAGLLEEVGPATEADRPELLVGVRGPGSFTGLRVGLATLAGLALAWGIPAVGVSTTAALALASGAQGLVVVILAGGHGRVFLASHVVSGNSLSTPLPVRDAAPEEALALVRQGGTALLRGTPPLAAELEQAGASAHEGPLAAAAIRLALGGEREALLPLYAREPSLRPTRP